MGWFFLHFQGKKHFHAEAKNKNKSNKKKISLNFGQFHLFSLDFI